MEDIVFDRLDNQVEWYESRSKRNQLRFKWLKYIEIVAAAMIPILAAIGGVPPWLTYRSTAEALKHEKFLYLAHAGAYAASANPRVLLAERIEVLVTDENTKWISHQQEAAAPAQESAEPS